MKYLFYAYCVLALVAGIAEYGLFWGLFWATVQVGWVAMAYLGHLKYPRSRGPIAPAWALFWTAVWSIHGVFKFLFLRD